MNDREQLEMAAKAAGINWQDWTRMCGHPRYDVWPYDWNPLTDDGDALRLVVRLKQLGLWNKPYTGEALDGWREDPYAATRRAIVRAAAEIGKAMP